MSKAKWNQARGVWDRKINPLRKQGFVDIPPGHPDLTAQAAAEAAEIDEKARLKAETDGFVRELLRLLPSEWKVTGQQWPDSSYTRLFLRAPDGRDAIAVIRPSGYALSTPGAVAERLLAAYASAASILFA
jgi:hypothetical protein